MQKKFEEICAAVMETTGIFSIINLINRQKIKILLYHQVNENNTVSKIGKVTKIDFDKQMVYLTKRFNIISIQDMDEGLKGNQNLPKNPLIITFDDGCIDNYTIAFPILVKYKLPFTIFLVANKIEKNGYLTLGNIKTMKKFGATYGSHTLAHPDLRKVSKERKKKEIFLSKGTIKKLLNNSTQFFAYPYGEYNQEIITLSKEAGYSYALTTKYGNNTKKDNPYELKRIPIYGNRTFSFFKCNLFFDMGKLEGNLNKIYSIFKRLKIKKKIR